MKVPLTLTFETPELSRYFRGRNNYQHSPGFLKTFKVYYTGKRYSYDSGPHSAQRLHYPLIKEYTLSYNRSPNKIYGSFP